MSMWERFGLIPSACACGFTGVCGSWALPGCLGLPIETLAFVWMRFAGAEMFGSVGVQWPEPPHPTPPFGVGVGSDICVMYSGPTAVGV